MRDGSKGGHVDEAGPGGGARGGRADVDFDVFVGRDRLGPGIPVANI